MERINEITLTGMLPDVFRAESIPNSQVWRSNLTLKRGCRILIEAASGGGKSSLCAYLYGTRTDYQGSLSFDSTDVRLYSISDWQEIRRRHIAYLPQELSLFPELSAWQNIQLKNRLTGALSDVRVEELLERLGISNRRDYPVGKMSIGQQQRVAIIRAVCQPFDFILLDEPVSHLDVANNRIAAEIIVEEAEQRGGGIISTSVGNAIDIPGMEHIRL